MRSFHLTEQIRLLDESRITLETELPNNPLPILTLVPPINFFDANTIEAMYRAHYETLSSENSPGITTSDGVIYYDNCNQSTAKQNFLFHWPEDAATSIKGNGIFKHLLKTTKEALSFQLIP